MYLTHEYLSTWWKHLSGSASLRIILVREAGELLAAAPLMVRRGTLLKCPVRRLEFAGSGWGYGGFILSKKKRECLRSVFAAVKEMDTWDVMYLGNTLGDPEIDGEELARMLSQTRFAHESVRVRIPYIPLGMTWEGYLAERSSSFRRNLKNRGRRLAELGSVRFLRITNLEESGIPLPKIAEWLHTVAGRSWKAKAGTAISSDSRVFSFYNDLAVRLNTMGSLDLSFLFLDERPVAYIFGAVYRNDYFEIDIAFDMELSKVSPGILVRNYLLKELLQKQLRKYDFVAYFDYKKDLTSYGQEFSVHVFYRKKPYPLVLRWLRDKVRMRMGHLLADYSGSPSSAGNYTD